MKAPSKDDGIVRALVDFAYDSDVGEGYKSAVDKYERWRDVLEEILEVAGEGHVNWEGMKASCSEQQMVTKLLERVNKGFLCIQHEAARIADSPC